MHQVRFYSKRKYRQDKRQRALEKLSRWRESKARKRQAAIDAGLLEREPKLERWFSFEFAVRDKRTGETHWHDLVSVRHASKALGLILKHCQ